MSLSQYDPLSSLRHFEDAVTRMFTEPQANRPWAPAVDVYETANDLVFKADLPEVELADIDLRVETSRSPSPVPASSRNRKEPPGTAVERPYGNFARSFTVPSTFDTDKINASFKNGVLTVSLPKKEAAKPRQVKIESVS